MRQVIKFIRDNRQILLAENKYNMYPPYIGREAIGSVCFNKPISHNLYFMVENLATKDIFINKIITVKIMIGRSLQAYQPQLIKAKDLIKDLKSRFAI